MKKIEMKVTLEFSEDIDEEFSKEIMNNVEQGLIDVRNEFGIVPYNCEAYTESIIVTKL